MFPKYPYLDLSDRNLDSLTKAIREMENEVKNFVSLNAVKYANPIQWSIARQYEKNTIVIDPLTGTAFISVQPVPSGVSLTRTQYWAPVFNFSQFVTKAASNFANSYERDITTTATIPTGAGDWVVWDSTLYVALTSIHAGDAYVVNGNIKRMTIEDFYDLLMQAIHRLDEELDTEIRNRTDADTTLQGNIDAEERAREEADTTLQDNIDAEERAREEADGDLSELRTADKSSLVAAINSTQAEINAIISQLIYYNVKEYGAVGDGSHDDTTAFKAAIADAKANGGGIIFVPKTNNRYIISDSLNLDGKLYVMGEARTTIAYSSTILFDCSHRYGGLQNLEIVSINGIGTGVHFDISSSVCYEWRFENLVFSNCQHAFDDAGIGTDTYIVDMVFDDILMVLGNGDQFVSRRSRGFMTLHNFKVDWTYNTNYCPYVGAKFIDVIGLELEKFDVLGPVSARVTPQYTPNQIGLQILGTSDGKASVWLTRINIDTSYGSGIVISNVRYVQGDMVECFGLWGFGLFVENCEWFNISNLYLVCSTGTTETPNGLSLTDCFDGVITNFVCLDWKDHGVVLNSSNRILINNMICNYNNTGILETGTSNSNLINGISLLSNNLDYSLIGNQTHIVNAIVDGIYNADLHI